MTEIHRFTHFLRNLDELVFRFPKAFLAIIAVLTVFFGWQVPKVEMYSDFADLLPQEHPYIQLHNEIRESFGGANNVVMAVVVDEGDIFTNDTLQRIHRVTQSVDNVSGVNHNLLNSLTHRTSRKVWLTDTGDVNSQPYYDPLKPDMTQEELDALRNDVVANPRVYGLLVSPDMKAALIKAQFNEGQLNYADIFGQLQEIRANEAAPGVQIYATGQPMLWGWVYSYLDQLMLIFTTTVAIMLVLLIGYFRRAYGILLPMFGICISAVWGLGILSLLGYNLDPLTLVIPFLISARAMSHAIQLVQRYYYELDQISHQRSAAAADPSDLTSRAHSSQLDVGSATPALSSTARDSSDQRLDALATNAGGNSGREQPGVEDGREAAHRTFDSLFRPGSLGIVSDAIGLLLIALGSVPINEKLGVYASLWAICVIFTVLIAVPLILSLLPKPKPLPKGLGLDKAAFAAIARGVSTPTGAWTVLGVCLAVMVAAGSFSAKVQVGESEPGSPILYLDHDYNVSSKNINERFPGSEELFVVARTAEKGGLKRPEVLEAIESFQRHMLLDPDLGGSKAIPDLVKQVNRIFHSDDPRWAIIPDTEAYVGGLMFAYMASSPVPGALKEFQDTDDQVANMVFFYKDHQAETIRRAIHMAKAWIENPDNQVEGLEFKLAGGLVGVTAAMNESAFESNMLIIPLVLLLIFVFVTWFYWSFHAGWIMFLAMVFCTTSTYAYMGLTGIGINVNTVPIIAVGIGVGIDYSIYIMDRIREEAARFEGDLRAAVRHAISTTGMAIGFTATCLIGGVIMWVFISDLRFQADAALLLVVMLMLNAIAAMMLVPAWIMAFRPKFVRAVHYDDDGVLQVEPS